jgi:hypothetical protein
MKFEPGVFAEIVRRDDPAASTRVLAPMPAEFAEDVRTQVLDHAWAQELHSMMLPP